MLPEPSSRPGASASRGEADAHHGAYDDDVSADEPPLELEELLLAGGEEPRCPHCAIVMRLATAGWVCPECGHLDPIDDDIQWPGEGEGIGSVNGG